MHRAKTSFAIGFVGLILGPISVQFPSTNCFAVTAVTVSPSTYTLGDVATVVLVQANTAAAGNTLVFDVYIDADGDKSIDPEDWRFSSFEIADGQAPHLGNADYWHDEDSAKNSSVKATLAANGSWWFSGHFIVKVTDANASTAKAAFTVIQDTANPCVVSGEVLLEGSPAGGAIIQVVDVATGNERVTVVTEGDGTFEFRIKSPGDYSVQAFLPDAVSKYEEGSAQELTVSEGDNSLLEPLVVFAGDRTISGRVTASDSGDGFRGVLVFGGEEELFTLTATDDNGYYSLAVVDGDWSVSALSEQIGRFGYLPPERRSVTVSGSDVSGIGLSCPRATTLISGNVKDSQTQQGLQGYSVYAKVQDGDEDQEDLIAYTAADGSYKIGVVQGQWLVDLEEDRLIGTGYADPPTQTVSAPASGTVSGIDFLLEKAGTITGHVYEDDGITPVAGAQVSVAIFGTWNWVTGDQTKSDGSYRVEVPAGTFMVVVSNISGWLTQFYNRKRFFPDATSVSVIAGQETSGIDFVLEPAATITGHVYQVDGITPIAGASAQAFDDFGNTFFADAVTGDDGLYSIAVPGGSYRVWADAGEHWVAEYYDDAHNPDDATVITLAVAEQKSGIDFVLEPAATIVGHVYEDDGTTPVEGAQVSVAIFGTWNWVAGDQTKTDGSYRVEVPPGTFMVVVGNISGWLTQFYNRKRFFADATQVNATAGQDTSGIDFVLEPAATISGHVYQEDGITPIAGADVRAFDELGNTFFADAVTGDDGLYSIFVPSGSYRVWADAGDRWVGEFYDDAHNISDAKVITLVVPEQKLGIDFALTEATATIEGHVYQQDGAMPIAGVQVYARDHVTEDFVGGTESGPDGSYILHVSPGTFTVWAWKHHWNLQYYDHTASSGKATPVTVSGSQAVQNVDFALEWIPFVVETMSRSSQWPGCMEVRWAWVPGMLYSVFWTEELDGTDTIWHEVPKPEKDIVKEGTAGGFMTWIDKGNSPGMNNSRPGDPIVRQRFYRVKEEGE